MKTDRDRIRELTRRYLEICQTDDQDRKRDLWRKQNSLRLKQPLIYVRAFAWREMAQSNPECSDSLFRDLENWLKNNLFRATFDDDSIFEPWLTLKATHSCTGWGIEPKRHYAENLDESVLGAYKSEYPLKSPDDLANMRPPRHEIDQQQTSANLEKLQDAVGDLVPIDLDRSPAFMNWTADISTTLGHLRGIENFMMDMVLEPEWLHRLLVFMRDGILKVHEEAEQAGDFSLTSHYNQAMPYSEELRNPVPNGFGVKRNDLWTFFAAQEYTGVSPQMHEEFLLQYQIPILNHFGLVSYGCCEDLTRKIDMLRQIPNLRRIAVSPMADVGKCAEQIGNNYVLSYRPSPADMVSYQWDPDRARKILRSDLQHCRNSYVDITLKDVETVERDPERIRNWVKITRQIIDELWG